MRRRWNDRRPSIANVIERKRFQSLRKDCRLETQSISGPAFVREINGRPNKSAHDNGSFADASPGRPSLHEDNNLPADREDETIKMFTADKLPEFSVPAARHPTSTFIDVEFDRETN